MKREDFEKAKELDNMISELTLKAEAMLQMATRLENAQCCGILDFGNALPNIRLNPEDLVIVAELYYKRYSTIQKQIGELTKEFYSI